MAAKVKKEKEPEQATPPLAYCQYCQIFYDADEVPGNGVRLCPRCHRTLVFYYLPPEYHTN